MATSREFIKKVSADTGKSQRELREFADIFEVALKSAVASGEKIKFADITYDTIPTPERMGRNIVTKELMPIPASKRLRAKFSKDFKRIIKE